MQFPLEDGDVAVWFLRTEDVNAASLDEADAVLSPEETAHCDRLRVPSDGGLRRRAHAAAAHALAVRRICSEGVAVRAARRREAGARCRPGGLTPLEFSLTHTRGLVACAVARGASVGVDAERDRVIPDAQAIATRHFSPSEVFLLAERAPSEAAAMFLISGRSRRRMRGPLDWA